MYYHKAKPTKKENLIYHTCPFACFGCDFIRPLRNNGNNRYPGFSTVCAQNNNIHRSGGPSRLCNIQVIFIKSGVPKTKVDTLMHKTQIGGKIVDNDMFRTVFFTYISFAVNALFAFAKGIAGWMTSSIWLIMLSAYRLQALRATDSNCLQQYLMRRRRILYPPRKDRQEHIQESRALSSAL